MKKALLHIEEVPPGQMRFQLENPITVARMVQNAMNSNTEIATLFLTAVGCYMGEKNMPFELLKKIYDGSKKTN